MSLLSAFWPRLSPGHGAHLLRSPQANGLSHSPSHRRPACSTRCRSRRRSRKAWSRSAHRPGNVEMVDVARAGEPAHDVATAGGLAGWRYIVRPAPPDRAARCEVGVMHEAATLGGGIQEGHGATPPRRRHGRPAGKRGGCRMRVRVGPATTGRLVCGSPDVLAAAAHAVSGCPSTARAFSMNCRTSASCPPIPASPPDGRTLSRAPAALSSHCCTDNRVASRSGSAPASPA